MAEIKGLRDSSLATVIDDDASLANGVRAAGDYDNSTELDMECEVYLQVQWDGTAPSAGDAVADLWILPGDGEVTPVFPEGGDAGLGTDDDPQLVFFVGRFITVNPSITVDEVLALPRVPLFFGENRFVLKNTSNQTFDSTFEVRIKPSKRQVV